MKKMKKIFLLNLTLILLSFKLLGQIGVNTVMPSQYAALHISERVDSTSTNPSEYRGIIIQRYSEVERDNQITPNLRATENGLLIFNTTENCYNYWNKTEREWKSLCGALGKAVFTMNCNGIAVYGNYIEGKELTASNYLSIPVTVTKAGDYSVTVTTENGYNFFVSGSFLSVGNHTIQVLGQGTPVAVQVDDLSFSLSGVNQVCTPKKTVEVKSASATYTMSCGSATINGVYKVGVALTVTNTISLPINVTSLGSYNFTTDVVNGMSFKASGTFTSIGNQYITLTGIGSPTTTTPAVFTITSDSQGGVSTSCQVKVIIVIPTKKVLHISSHSGYGYSAYDGGARKVMDTPTNFGVLETSTVKIDGFIHTSLPYNVSEAQLSTALNNKPDIIIIGYDILSLNRQVSDLLVDYLNKDGVVIFFHNATLDNYGNIFLRKVFGDQSITPQLGWLSGAVFQFNSTNHPILNGPFGDIRNKYWGEDASQTLSVSNLTDITAFSYATPINSPNQYSGITSFVHNSLNFVWFGDGGFTSNNIDGAQWTDPYILPFVAPPPTYKPGTHTAYGRAGNGYTVGTMQVSNAIAFANIIAWAINQAEFHGINKN